MRHDVSFPAVCCSLGTSLNIVGSAGSSMQKQCTFLLSAALVPPSQTLDHLWNSFKLPLQNLPQNYLSLEAELKELQAPLCFSQAVLTGGQRGPKKPDHVQRFCLQPTECSEKSRTAQWSLRGPGFSPTATACGLKKEKKTDCAIQVWLRESRKGDLSRKAGRAPPHRPRGMWLDQEKAGVAFRDLKGIARGLQPGILADRALETPTQTTINMAADE
eukprot:1146485-Pelagomonas_calceolata.AAC.1